MFLLRAEPWLRVGTHLELGIRYIVWEFYSFHCKDNDSSLQRLLKENKRHLMMSLPITFLIVFHQSCIFLKDSKTRCHTSEKKVYC